MAYPTPDDVAVGNCGATKSATPNATWHGATPIGNKLYAFLQLVPTGVNAPTVTAKPSALWTLEAGPVGGDGGANNDPIIICYSIEAAASRSSNEQFTVSASCAWTMYLVSMPGMANPAADKIQVSNNTSAIATGQTGVTAATTQADEMAFGVIAVKNQTRALTAETETNGLTVTVQSEDANSVATASQGLASQLLSAHQTATGTRGFSDTITASSPYSGLIVTGKAASAGSATTDAATPVLSLVPSSSENAQDVEATTVALALTPIDADVAARVDSATVIIALAPSSAEVFAGIDLATTSLALSPSDSQLFAGIDANTVALLTAVSANADIAALIDSNTVNLGLVPSSSDGIEHTDSSVLPFSIAVSSQDIAQFVDNAVMSMHLTPSSTDIEDVTDSNTILLNLNPSSSDILGVIDSAILPLNMSVSSADVAAFTESAILPLILTPSGVDVKLGTGADIGTGVLTLSPSGPETALYSDESILLMGLSPSGSEIHERFDASVLPLLLTPSGVDVYSVLDINTVALFLKPSGVEFIASLGDEQTVILHLTPAALVEVLLMVNFYGRIGNRWEGLNYNRWISLDLLQRWIGRAW